MAEDYYSEEEFPWERYLSGRGGQWSRHLAEEADEPFDVLRSRRQEELLANKLHPTQAQATKSDLILEFREQRLYLSSLPLRVGEGGSVGLVSGALPGGLMDMDGEILVLARGALRFLRARTATLAASDVGVGLTFSPTKLRCWPAGQR